MSERPQADTTGRSCAECRRQGMNGPISALSDYGEADDPRCWIHAIYETPIWQRQEEEQ